MPDVVAWEAGRRSCRVRQMLCLSSRTRRDVMWYRRRRGCLQVPEFDARTVEDALQFICNGYALASSIVCVVATSCLVAVKADGVDDLGGCLGPTEDSCEVCIT